MAKSDAKLLAFAAELRDAAVGLQTAVGAARGFEVENVFVDQLFDDMERSNVVCHFQLAPMYEGIWHVSRPRGYEGTFPFIETAH